MRGMGMMAATYPLALSIPGQDGVSAWPTETHNIPRWLQLIRAEYIESPGLKLTEPQVRRLWGLDALMAEALLSALLDVGFLRRTREGAYVRSDQR